MDNKIELYHIIKNAKDYIVCQKCNSINYVSNDICHNCKDTYHGYTEDMIFEWTFNENRQIELDVNKWIDKQCELYQVNNGYSNDEMKNIKYKIK